MGSTCSLLGQPWWAGPPIQWNEGLEVCTGLVQDPLLTYFPNSLPPWGKAHFIYDPALNGSAAVFEFLAAKGSWKACAVLTRETETLIYSKCGQFEKREQKRRTGLIEIPFSIPLYIKWRRGAVTIVWQINCSQKSCWLVRCVQMTKISVWRFRLQYTCRCPDEVGCW